MTTHPARSRTPLYFETFEMIERRRREERERHPWRYTKAFERMALRNVRHATRRNFDELAEQADRAARIAATITLNPDGAGERLGRRIATRIGCEGGVR